MRLEANYDRSWGAIGRALERAGVEVVAQSIEMGVYEVDYVIRSTEEEDEPGFFKKVVTLNGLFNRKDPPRFYPLKIQVLEINGEVEVLVESLELLPQPTADTSEAEISLLRLIRNNIA